MGFKFFMTSHGTHLNPSWVKQTDYAHRGSPIGHFKAYVVRKNHMVPIHVHNGLFMPGSSCSFHDQTHIPLFGGMLLQFAVFYIGLFLY